MPICLLKDCVGILLLFITKLVNLSLAEGVFPQKIKKAVVTPLMKKASLQSEDFKNYRLVSQLFHVKIGGAGSCQRAHVTYQQ